MINKNQLFIEETTPDFQYNIVWREDETDDIDTTVNKALAALQSIQTTNRLELWSKSHAETYKGFAPMAFRDKNSTKVMISHTLKMLGGIK